MTTIAAADLDLLEAVEVRTVTSRQLREGMVLVDSDFDTPVAVLDHRIGNLGAGIVQWLAEDLEAGGWFTVTFPTTLTPTIRVAAGIEVAA